jgi:hypothetical protein
MQDDHRETLRQCREDNAKLSTVSGPRCDFHSLYDYVPTTTVLVSVALAPIVNRRLTSDCCRFCMW